ncbi:MAG TPA: prepilin-type N-terminal cleavage/methylation domain-containing protein [Nitrospira sp.]|nr:prepilin-type N-terminal cleavage/methylation domain-containing protein [Nitrospira sp.]
MACVEGKNGGFTLLEVLVVLAMLCILAAAAMVSHSHFVDHAKAVEAEVVLAEIERLEMLYHANHGTYSSDVTAIGLTLVSALKYYKVEVWLDDVGGSFQAAAIPLFGKQTQPALVLTHTRDGTTLQKQEVGTLARQSQALPLPIGMSSSPEGQTEMSTGTQRKAQQEDCRKGGEATVAADGMLDMNFCLK